MHDNNELFNFFAIVQLKKNELSILRIRVARDLQQELTSEFTEQANEFFDPEKQKKSPDSGYEPDETEIFSIDKFKLPEFIKSAILFPEEIGNLKPDEETVKKVKAIFAGYQDDQSKGICGYFQFFNCAKIIEPKRALIFKDEMFQKLVERGIRIDTKLAAVYKNEELLFFSSSIKSFLDISDYFKEATDEQVRSILTSDQLETDDVEKILKQTTSWMRKRFTGIIQADVLKKTNPKVIKSQGHNFGVKVEIVKKNGKDAIHFPIDKKEMKELLKLLNEEYFVGILTKNKYQTDRKLRIP